MSELVSLDPRSGSPVGTVVTATVEGVSDAVSRSRRAFLGWSELSHRERRRYLKAYKRHVLANLDRVSAVVRTVSLTPPVAGTVIVSSTANVSTESAGGVVSCSIGLLCLPASGYTQIWESPGPNGSNGQLAGTRGFSVTGGALFEAGLVCSTGGASATATIRDSSPTAVFIPNP